MNTYVAFLRAINVLEAFIVSRPKPNGFFGFPNNFIEKELVVSATTRNWSTVTKLLEFSRKAMSAYSQPSGVVAAH